MPIQIRLPSQFQGVTLSKIVSEFEAGTSTCADRKIELDFSKLKFIKPTGVVFLSNLIGWLKVNGYTVSLTNLSNYSDPLHYLDDSLFFEQHCGQKLRETACVRRTTLPLKAICHAESHAWIRLQLIPWMASSIGINEPSLYPLQTCISELFNNIKDHTMYDIGSVFVQHYPAKNEITIAISDFGRGIPAAVRALIPNLSDNQAIQTAVQEGFTTRSVPNNAGIGLYYLLETVVGGLRGKVTIYSLKGMVQFENSGTKWISHAFNDVGFCPGTTIAIDVQTDRIEVLPSEREDLAWF